MRGRVRLLYVVQGSGGHCEADTVLQPNMTSCVNRSLRYLSRTPTRESAGQLAKGHARRPRTNPYVSIYVHCTCSTGPACYLYIFGRFTMAKTRRPAISDLPARPEPATASCRFTIYTSWRPAALRDHGTYTMWREENRLQLKGSEFLLVNCGF